MTIRIEFIDVNDGCNGRKHKLTISIIIEDNVEYDYNHNKHYNYIWNDICEYDHINA